MFRINLKKQIFTLIYCLIFTVLGFSQWAQKGVDIDGEATLDYFGGFYGKEVSISADGNTFAASGERNDGGGSDAGHVRVYNWNGSAWVQKGVNIDGQSAGDFFGRSVDISANGDTVVVGAYSGNFGAGYAKVYRWNGSAWVQLGSTINGEGANDWCGQSVSITPDGATIIVGSDASSIPGSFAGHIRVFDWNGSSWIKRGPNIRGDAAWDRFGGATSISSNGNIIAIGAWQNSGAFPQAGQVKVYEWKGTFWQQMGSSIYGVANGDELGRSVSLNADGTILAIGAPANDVNGSHSGHVRIFEWSGSAWLQKGSDINGLVPQDQLGTQVSLSSSGELVAIGARNNGGTGYVSVYKWLAGDWSLYGSNILGEASGDRASMVDISADGTSVIIGAGLNTDNGSNGTATGHVRIFEWTGPLPIEGLVFNAKWNNEEQSESLISWTTETEINNEFFYVERSTDAIRFQDIAKIDGAGNSAIQKKYKHVDDSFTNEENTLFYRLRQTDFDGTLTYSSIATLNKTIGINLISLYPNPNIGHFKYIISSSVESNVKITITDLLGEIVKEKIEEINEGVNHLSLSVEELSSANYFIHIETENGLHHTSSKFILSSK